MGHYHSRCLELFVQERRLRDFPLQSRIISHADRIDELSAEMRCCFLLLRSAFFQALHGGLSSLASVDVLHLPGHFLWRLGWFQQLSRVHHFILLDPGRMRVIVAGRLICHAWEDCLLPWKSRRWSEVELNVYRSWIVSLRVSLWYTHLISNYMFHLINWIKQFLP